MMQAHKDGLHLAWDLQAEIDKYCTLFPQYADAFNPSTEQGDNANPQEGDGSDKGQPEGTSQIPDAVNEDEGGDGDA